MKQLLFLLFICLSLSCSKNKKETTELGIVALGYINNPSFLASFPGTLESMEWLGKSQYSYDIPVNKLIDFAYRYEAPLGFVHVPVGEYHAVKLKFSFNNHSSWFFSVGDLNTEVPSNWFSPLLIDQDGNELQSLTGTFDVVINLAQPVVVKKDHFNFLVLNFLMDKSLLAVQSADQPAWIFSPIVEVLGADSMVWPMEIEEVTSEGVKLTWDNVSFFSPDPLWQLNSVSATGTPEAADLKGQRVLASVKLNEKGELLIPSINVLSNNLYLGQITPHPEGSALMGHEFSPEGVQFIKSLVFPFSTDAGEEHVNNEYFVPGQQVELFYDATNSSIQKMLFHPSEVIGQLADVDGAWRITPITINGVDAISFYLEDFAFDNSDAKFSAGDLVKVSGQFHQEGDGVRLEVLETQKLQSSTPTENTNVRLQMAFSDEQMVTLNDALMDLDAKSLHLANLGSSVSRHLISEDTQVMIDAPIENVKDLDVADYLVFTHEEQELSGYQLSGTTELYAHLAQLPSDYAIFQMEIVGKIKEGNLVAENVVLRYRKKQNNGLEEEETPISLEEGSLITKAESVNPLFALAGAGGLVAVGASVFATWKLLRHSKGKKSQNALANNQEGEGDADTIPKIQDPTLIWPRGPQPQGVTTVDEVFKSSARDENGNPVIDKKVTDKGKNYWEDANGKKWEITPEPYEMDHHRLFNRDFARGLGVGGKPAREGPRMIKLTEAEKNLLGTTEDGAIIREFNESLESLADKDSNFFDDRAKLKAGEKEKLVSAAIYSIIFNKDPGNVMDLFEYDPEQKVLVEKIRPTETFQSELTKDIEPKLLKFGQNSQEVKARNIAVDLEVYLKGASPKVKFSRDEITRQVKLLADFGSGVKLNNILGSELYTPEEANILVERFKDKRAELFIDYLPEEVSAEEYKAHMKRKYLDNWVSKYHQFTPTERAKTGTHKSVMFELFKSQQNVDPAYAAFIDENKVFVLNDYYRWPQPAQDYVDSKITQWVDSGEVSIEELPPKSFKKYITQNKKQAGLPKIKSYFTKKYGDDFQQKLWVLNKPDLESYNLAGEILDKPTYDSREDFLKKIGAKYATHPELLNNPTRAELAAANQYRLSGDKLTVEVENSIKTVTAVNGVGPSYPARYAYIFSDVKPGNAFEFGLSSKGGDGNISSLADLSFIDQAEGKSRFAYLKLDQSKSYSSEKLISTKLLYSYLVDVSDAEAFSKSKQNISGKLFQINDVIATKYLDPTRIISAQALKSTRAAAVEIMANPNYRKKTK